MRVVRELRSAPAGFVPLSFIPFQTLLLHARRGGDLARGEPQAHPLYSAGRWGARFQACRRAG
jgi:hypothetical protein